MPIPDYIDKDKPVTALLKEMAELRKALWLHHGCEGDALYGDDGEMQCLSCIIDFIRMPAEIIEHRLTMRKRGILVLPPDKGEEDGD